MRSPGSLDNKRDAAHKGDNVCWRSLTKAAGLLPGGKSCRLRCTNYTRPDLRRGGFTEDEDDLIIRLYALLGNRWSLIAGRLPGRTDNEVMKHWNSHLKAKLATTRINPGNHRIGHMLPLSYSRNDQSSPKIDSHRASRPASCPRDAVVRVLPDLNLDLTVPVPHSVSGNEELKGPTGLGNNNTGSPTLLLFR